MQKLPERFYIPAAVVSINLPKEQTDQPYPAKKQEQKEWIPAIRKTLRQDKHRIHSSSLQVPQDDSW